jgi:GntR family transcriptional regulator, transcriptional repressor for pyruvate dehydrogenase complex
MAMKADLKTLIDPVRNRRTFEEVSDKLKELIFNGTLIPGQPLPSEHALAQLFQVGRQSIREALRVLEISGFITVRAGTKGGAVIEGTLLSKMADMFLDTFKLHRVSLQDCMNARKAIEVSILDFVLRNADEEDIERLRESIRSARIHFSRNESTYEDNIDFHRFLAKASKNYTFCIVMESILVVYAEFRGKTARSKTLIKENTRKIIDTHEALVEAIAARKNELAVELLKRDLAFSEELFVMVSANATLPAKPAPRRSRSKETVPTVSN